MLDVLRGAAIFGILLVNMGSFAHPIDLRTVGLEVAPGSPDALAQLAVRFFAEGKFFPLFSLLFGVGFFVQAQRAERAGVPFGGRWSRRLGILAGIGFVHGAFVWAGDILLPYALLGFGLLLVQKARPRTLLFVAGGLVALVVLAYAALCLLWGLLLALAGEHLAALPEEARKSLAEAYLAYRGSVGEVFVQRLGDWASYTLATLVGAGPVILAMFVSGLWLGRKGVVEDPGAHRPLLRRVLGVGLLLGLPLSACATWLGREPLAQYEDAALLFASASTSLLAGLLLCGAWASGLTLLWLAPAGRRLLAFLAPVGRMALSHYLLQSLVLTTVFYGGFGFGLMGSTGPLEELLLSIALFAVQVALGRAWLARFRFGPAEWAWRSLTYGKRQPTRVESPAVVAPTP